MSKIEKQDASTPEKKAEDGLAAKVRKMSETLNNVVRVLEKHFGVDLDKDGRSGFASLRLCVATALLSFVAMGALALSPLADTNNVWSVTDSTGTNVLADVSRVGALRAAGAISGSGAVSVGSTLAVTGIATFAATQTVFSAAAVANTNAAVPVQGIAVRVNGTNYVLKLYPITGP